MMLAGFPGEGASNDSGTFKFRKCNRFEVRCQILFQLLLQFISDCKSKKISKSVVVCGSYQKKTA